MSTCPVFCENHICSYWCRNLSVNWLIHNKCYKLVKGEHVDGSIMLNMYNKRTVSTNEVCQVQQILFINFIKELHFTCGGYGKIKNMLTSAYACYSIWYSQMLLHLVSLGISLKSCTVINPISFTYFTGHIIVCGFSPHKKKHQCPVKTTSLHWNRDGLLFQSRVKFWM